MGKSGAKRIESDRMRRPRSHANMVVFTFGARKKQELPCVMGVMSDLSGKSNVAQPELTKREFLQINAEQSLDSRMAAMRPRVAFPVPNQMSPEQGDLMVDLEFESMDDFKPDRVAAKVKPLRELLEQRDSINNLKNYVGGKDHAEKALEELLKKIDTLAGESR